MSCCNKQTNNIVQLCEMCAFSLEDHLPSFAWPQEFTNFYRECFQTLPPSLCTYQSHQQQLYIITGTLHQGNLNSSKAFPAGRPQLEMRSIMSPLMVAMFLTNYNTHSICQTVELHETFECAGNDSAASSQSLHPHTHT